MQQPLPAVVGVAALILAACGGKPPAQGAGVAPVTAEGRRVVRVEGSDTVRMVNGVLQSAGNTQRSAKEEAWFKERYARAQAAAARIDSVLVTPAVLEMRVGDSLPLIGKGFTMKAVDSAGVEVAGFLPGTRLLHNSVVKLSRQHLVAIRPGAAALRVEVVGQHPQRTVTEVAIIVRE